MSLLKKTFVNKIINWGNPRDEKPNTMPIFRPPTPMPMSTRNGILHHAGAQPVQPIPKPTSTRSDDVVRSLLIEIGELDDESASERLTAFWDELTRSTCDDVAGLVCHTQPQYPVERKYDFDTSVPLQ